MKSKWTLILILLIATFLHAYKAFHSSGIRGRILPVNSVHSIKAFNSSDTIEARVENGVFMLEAKPGIYNMLIESYQPDKNVVVQSIKVAPGKTFDLGEIKVPH